MPEIWKFLQPVLTAVVAMAVFFTLMRAVSRALHSAALQFDRIDRNLRHIAELLAIRLPQPTDEGVQRLARELQRRWSLNLQELSTESDYYRWERKNSDRVWDPLERDFHICAIRTYLGIQMRPKLYGEFVKLSPDDQEKVRDLFNETFQKELESLVRSKAYVYAERP